MYNYKSVGIVLLNWNGWKDTIECIESIRKSNYESYNIVIVDNASTDNSVNEIKRYLNINNIGYSLYDYLGNENFILQYKSVENSSVIIIKSSKNDGFASGNNIGFKYLFLNNTVEYIWILNNDVVISSDSIKNLVEFYKYNPNSIIGSSVLEYYDRKKIQYLSGAKYNRILGRNKPLFKGYSFENIKDISQNLDLDYIGGCSIFIKSDILKQIGMLNEKYFLYYEEIDLCKKAKSLGLNLAWCKDSIVYHKGGASIGSENLIRKKSAKSEYYGNLSSLIYTRNNEKDIFTIFFVCRFISKSLFFLKEKRFKLFRPLIQAYKDFIKGNY